MQIYLGPVFNHFRALQAWAMDKDAAVTLDVRTFEVEVKYRNRYYLMQPLFQARENGRLVHTEALPQHWVAFGGWRPYKPVRHPLSTDKLAFKRFLVERGLRTPECALAGASGVPPVFDYLIKGVVGSFGREIAGPFRAGLAMPEGHGGLRGDLSRTFAEQFIHGSAVKVWFWGEQAFFAHVHDFPVLTGDGASTIEALLTNRLKSCRLDWATHPDRDLVLGCLQFQGVSPSEVLVAGRSVWFDYRYSQRYEPAEGTTARSDTELPHLLRRTGDEVPLLGAAVAAMLRHSFPAPIMVTVDGILDSEGRTWWLEMNTNSVMPPEGYAVMFADLFA